MAYVPPHKRGQMPREKILSPEGGLPTRKEESTISSLQEICKCLGTQKLHTLTEAPASPGLLSLIIIHDGQHPDWPSTILCKTNLHLLPDHNAVHACEYPVFVEAPFHSRKGRKAMVFDGWWRISRVDYMEPQSEELIALLERKFSRPIRRGRFGSDRHDQGKARTAEAWAESLSTRWAVISLEKDKGRIDNPLNKLSEATQNYQSLNTPIQGEGMLAPASAERETQGIRPLSIDQTPR